MKNVTVCFIKCHSKCSRGADRGYHAPPQGLNPMHILLYSEAVSYTHLTLPTNREV